MKKGSPALLIAALGKPKGPMPPKSSPDMESEEDEPAPASDAAPGEDTYGSELADMLGVGEDDRADFNTALAGFVRACIRKEQ